MTIVLITGGRDYDNYPRTSVVMAGLVRNYGPDICFVQGGAPGADAAARHWCVSNGVACLTMDAPWDFYGKRAGHWRNAQMVRWVDVDFVVAFPGGPGTASMRRIALGAGLAVHVVDDETYPQNTFVPPRQY